MSTELSKMSIELSQPKSPIGQWEKFNSADWRHLFNSLEDVADRASLAGKLIINSQRNLHHPVWPYDDNRIILASLPNPYINASPVRVPAANAAYILAQSPSARTAHHLWLMVWQENCPGVVMLGQAADYFPRNLGESRIIKGDSEQTAKSLVVRCLTVRTAKGFEARKLELTNGRTSHHIQHFHFHCWRHHCGVPSTKRRFLSFLVAVRQAGLLANQSRPSVIHCSNGSGRAGMFAVIDASLKLGANQRAGTVAEVMKLVSELRQQRMKILNNWQQLKFACSFVAMGLENLPDNGKE